VKITHELKTDSKMFDDVVAGKKNFEIRFNDRGYRIGDELILRKTKYTGIEMKEDGKPLEYVGSPLHVYVTYILAGGIYGLVGSWVIMSIEPRDGCA